MIFQKLLLQYSNSRNYEKWRLAVTTEFRVKPRFLWGEHSYQPKNILLLQESRFLEIDCAPPVYSVFTLRAEGNLDTLQKGQNPIWSAYKEDIRSTWNAEKSLIRGTLLPQQEGKDHSRYNWNIQSIHRSTIWKSQKGLQKAEDSRTTYEISLQHNPQHDHNY